MSRIPRTESPLNLYHVCDRGVNKRVIFDDDTDRRVFVSYLAGSLEKHDGDLLAWCLMTNHIHLVVQMEKDEMSKTMQGLVGRYARYYNARHGRTGYLMQDRFKSQPIDTAAYLLSAVRYVHQNPLKAGITASCSYPWSSYWEYLGKPKLTSTELVLGILGGKGAFLSLHEESEDDLDFIDVDNGWRVDEDDALNIACRAIGEDNVKLLGTLEAEVREKLVGQLLSAKVPGIQIAKMAHMSSASVSRIKKKLAAESAG